jgi:hypothetical protein
LFNIIYYIVIFKNIINLNINYNLIKKINANFILKFLENVLLTLEVIFQCRGRIKKWVPQNPSRNTQRNKVIEVMRSFTTNPGCFMFTGTYTFPVLGRLMRRDVSSKLHI